MNYLRTNNLPLVSVICFCRNAKETIKRCMDSIVAQDYSNMEVIVQDGASTDGTIEILHSYGIQIDLISEPDKGSGDAMFKAINRSKGEIFIACLADEELLPFAVSWGVEQLAAHPHAGVIYGDYFATDIEGNITDTIRPKTWNYKQLLCSEFIPPFCTSFLRRSVYNQIGLTNYTDCGEFELWVLLGLKIPVVYVPGLVAKYAVHEEQLSMQIDVMEGQAIGKFRALERFFNRLDLPVGYDQYKEDAISAIYTWMVNGYCNIQAWEQACSAFHFAYTKDRDIDRLHYAGMRLLNHGLSLIKNGRIQDAREFIELPFKTLKAFHHIDLFPIKQIYDHFYNSVVINAN